MGGAPSKPGDSSRGLEVIGAGYSRTGTVSTQLALEKVLNGPVLHGGTHMITREDGSTPEFPLTAPLLSLRVLACLPTTYDVSPLEGIARVCGGDEACTASLTISTPC